MDDGTVKRTNNPKKKQLSHEMNDQKSVISMRMRKILRCEQMTHIHILCDAGIS